MMVLILKWKDQILRFVGRYEVFVYAAIRFVVAWIAFSMINRFIGGLDRGNLISLLLAMACAFLPSGVMLFVSALLIVLQLYSQYGMEMAAGAFLLFVIMFFMYFRFTSGKGMYAILTPILGAAGIPYVMPVTVGLLRQPQHIVSVICGSVTYFAIKNARDNASIFQEGNTADQTVSRLGAAGRQIFGDTEMYIYLVAFAAAAIVVYLICRSTMTHCREVALVTGCILQLLIIGGGEMIIGNTEKIPGIFIGCIISCVISYFVSLMSLSLNYDKVEHVQFEDDEYYYYVKAVPKVSVTMEDKQVTMINSNTGEEQKKEPDENEPDPESEDQNREQTKE